MNISKSNGADKPPTAFVVPDPAADLAPFLTGRKPAKRVPASNRYQRFAVRVAYEVRHYSGLLTTLPALFGEETPAYEGDIFTEPFAEMVKRVQRTRHELYPKYRQYLETVDEQVFERTDDDGNLIETVDQETFNKSDESKDWSGRWTSPALCWDDWLNKNQKPAKPEKPKPTKPKHVVDWYPPDDDDYDDKRTLRRIWNPPHDYWGHKATETLREGMVPQMYWDVGSEYARRNGMDRDTLIMSMLTCTSMMIPTNIVVAANRAADNKFKEAIRIWQLNVGDSGAGKSPILDAVLGVLNEIDDKMYTDFTNELADYESRSKEEQKNLDKPKRRRLIMPDSTMEKQEVIYSENPGECVGIQSDEIVGWFGAKSRYSNKSGGGEQSERAFRLSMYDSTRHSAGRISRKDVDCFPSSSVIGGIQPTVLPELIEDASRNDGLVQRFNAMMMHDEMGDADDSIEPEFPLTIYEAKIRDMFKRMPLRLTGAELHFSDKAALVRDEFFKWTRESSRFHKATNPQLAKHLSKFRGMFLRFCGLFHMVDHYGDTHARQISGDTANMVYRFLTSFRYSHATAFYSLIRQSEENDDMKNIAEFILGHRLDKVSAREIQRGSSRFRGLTTRDISNTASTMVALGWLYHIDGKRRDSFNWEVNPDVHEMFKHLVGGIKERLALRLETKAQIRAKLGLPDDDD